MRSTRRSRLLTQAEAGPLDEFQRAQVDVLRARISFAADRGSEAPRLLLAAARRLEALDVRLAREIYLDALTATLFAGRLGGGCDARQVATAARAAPPSPSPPRAADLLLDGLALLITEGHTAATPTVRKALTAFHSDETGTEEGLRWLWLAGRTAGFIWDYESWDSLTARQVRVAREVGALGHLPLAFSTRVGVHLFAGELRAAASLVEQSDALAEATYGRIVPLYGALALAAFRGSEDEVTRLVRTNTPDFITRGEGIGLTVSQWVTAVLYNGLARYEDAFTAAADATTDPHELWFSTFATVELIEAASRSGRTDRAAEAFELLRESTRASGTPWALGVEARSRALLTHTEGAEALYREAIDLLQPTRLRLDLARTHLLYGEWLRRQRRRLDARNQLRVAHELFADFGMEAFAERARLELQATGEHARKRTVDTLDQLTPQEAQIAHLTAKGYTNRDIAAQLFISPSTVEYHLRKVFRKLDVTSRTQLAHRVLGGSRRTPSSVVVWRRDGMPGSATGRTAAARGTSQRVDATRGTTARPRGHTRTSSPVRGRHPVGTDEIVRDRLRRYDAAGITTLRANRCRQHVGRRLCRRGELLQHLTIDPPRTTNPTDDPKIVRDVSRHDERNGRDSNPRAFRPPAFKAGAIVHSATVPWNEGSGGGGQRMRERRSVIQSSARRQRASACSRVEEAWAPAAG